MKQMMKRGSYHRLLQIMLMLGLSACCFYVAEVVAATGSSQSLGDVATNIRGSFKAVAKLVTAGAYIAGLGFAVGAILKFKAHKDNPTQIPIGTPIALLFVAAALIFLPTILGVTGQTMFKESATPGSPSGETQVVPR